MASPSPTTTSARMIESARRSADAAVKQTDPRTQRSLIRCAAKYIEGALAERMAP